MTQSSSTCLFFHSDGAYLAFHHVVDGHTQKWLVHLSIRPLSTLPTHTCNVEDGLEQAFTTVRQVSDLGVGVKSKLWRAFGRELSIGVV